MNHVQANARTPTGRDDDASPGANGQQESSSSDQPPGRTSPPLQPIREHILSSLQTFETALNQYEVQLTNFHGQSTWGLIFLLQRLSKLQLDINQNSCHIRGCHYCGAPMRHRATRHNGIGSDVVHTASGANSPVTLSSSDGSALD
ncbi:uncharacterized protein BP5553_04587 [Venustampulla echinocandica]|uniref:Uncharacterized protein n=1 Tax=Venustampulla echinocandica TaxID=2656787 RepID=A0A370TNR3_9HELO|nr:uncharacterized protein BP5553_04587 [Venustampulla echinocandica]RDL37154.1 hypothetical protein BP5553_04587 [Venustampulla echinocandica]